MMTKGVNHLSREEDDQKRKPGVGGLAFAACFFAGLGIGFAMDWIPEAIFIGMAAGFGAMAAIRYKTGGW